MSPDELVHACRVPESVEPATSGLWTIRRVFAAELANPFAQAYIRFTIGGYDSYTLLERATLATMHRDHGECVMEDSVRELRRHLPILLVARGRVLVSGLGLGCVLRGLLAKTEVEHVDVVEIDPGILALVGREFADNPRVRLHLGDVESIEWPVGTRWDFAWHDVWSETESLDVVHGRILLRYDSMCDAQGAWQFARPVKRAWPRPLVNARRTQRTRTRA